MIVIIMDRNILLYVGGVDMVLLYLLDVRFFGFFGICSCYVCFFIGVIYFIYNS